jgi:hypothetical protein
MLPAYAWVLSIVTILGAVTTVAAAVHVAVRRSGLTAAVAGALLGWTLLVSVLADQGVFRAGPGNPVPWIGVAILVEVGGLLAAARLPFARRMAAEPATLTLLHVFRIPAGVMFLLLAAADRLPAVFALPAGIGDVAVGSPRRSSPGACRATRGPARWCSRYSAPPTSSARSRSGSRCRPARTG